MDKWNSRKLLSAIIAFVGGFVLCAMGKITGGEFVTLTLGTVGTLITVQGVADGFGKSS